MKNLFTILIVVAAAVPVNLYGQIIGNSPVNAGETHNYYYVSTSTIAPSWNASSEGSVTFQWSSGSTHYADIQWNSAGTGTVYLNDNNSGSTIATKSVTINLGLPTAINGERCGSGTVTLGAVPGTGGTEVRWFAVLRPGGTPLWNGTSFTTPSISVSTTYYIETYNPTTGAISPRVPVTATVNGAIAPPTNPNNPARCGTGPVTLSASPSGSATALRWYNADGTVLLDEVPGSEGYSYTTHLSATKTFQVSSYSAACGESSKISVTATVNNVPNDPIGGSFVACAQGVMTLSATIPVRDGAPLGDRVIAWYDNPTGGTPLWQTGTTYSPNITATKTYYISTKNSVTGCESPLPRETVTVTLSSPPSNPTIASTQQGFEGMLEVTATGAYGYQWFDNAGNILPGENSATLLAYFAAPSTTYVVKGVSAGGCMSSPGTSATISPVPLPVISFTGSNFLPAGSTLNLSVQNIYHTYQWKKDGVNVPSGGTSATYTATSAGEYTVEVSLPNGTKRTANSVRLVYLQNRPTTSTPSYDNNEPALNTSPARKNFVRTFTAKKAGLVAADFTAAGFNSTKVLQTTQFIDGLGMPVQTVERAASTGGLDVVTHAEYDAFARVPKEYLAYSSNTTPDADGYRNNAKREQYHFYRDGNPGVPVTGVAYSEKVLEPSPLNRVTKQAFPGEPWKVGSGHEISEIGRTYIPSEDGVVILWTVNTSGQLVQSGYYSGTKLSVVVAIDEDKREVRSFKDRGGRVVMKETKGDGGVWLKTYYVYDQFDNVAFVLPPEAVKALPTNFVWATHATTILDPWAFQYKYDKRNRVIEKKIPGSGWVYIIYDKLDRPVLTQDAVQRATNKWSFTKYDKLGRPILSGVTTNTTAYATLRTNISASTGYEVKTSPSNDYTLNGSVPTVLDAEVLVKTFYDDYNLPSFFSASYNFVSELSATTSDRLINQPTASMARNLNDNSWMGTKSYYDVRGRVVQVISSNHRGWYDRVTNKYIDITDKIEQIRTTHRVGTANELVLIRTFTYDNNDRLLQEKHKTGSQNEVILVDNIYNEIGQLNKKRLHSTDDGKTFLQSIDHKYNIRGLLTAINDAALSGDFTDQFGMEFSFESGFEQNQFGSNISGVRWKHAREEKQRAYGFVYDNVGRLKLSDHALRNATTNNWTDELGRYNEHIKDYDLNGNIVSLERYGLTNPATQTFGLMDNLSYTYAASTGNQLSKVDDATGNAEGFKNGVNAGADFTYDANGNMISDQNKTITTIEYNHLNLPKRVLKSNGDQLKYHYNAAGVKLRQELWRNGAGTAEKITDYIGEFVYENDVLKFAHHEAGRVNLTGTPAYEYELKDHLGNVRTLIGGTSQQFLATMEKVPAATDTQENAMFQNMNSTKKVAFNNYTPGAGNSYSYLLRGIAGEVVGPAKSFAVQPGEYYEMEVYGKYANSGSGTSGLSTLFTSLAGAFALNPSGGTGIDGQQAYNTFNGIFGPGPYVGDEVPYESETAPKAYLNYILFDTNFNPVDFDFDQIAYGATATHDKMMLNVKIQQAGYLYVYISNENPTPQDVWFDDFRIKRTYIDVIQTNDYYGYGLEIKGTSFTKAGSLPNMQLYNDKEKQDELDLGWLDYGARMYMSDIGRWGVVDPLSEKYMDWTPYKYSYDNPIVFTDPDGMGEVYGESISSIAKTGSVQTSSFAFEGKVYHDRDKLNSAIILSAVRAVGMEVAKAASGGGVVTPPDSPPFYSFNSATQARREWMAKELEQRAKENEPGFWRGAWDGLVGGGKSTVDFFSSLATAQGWEDMVEGLAFLGAMANPTMVTSEKLMFQYQATAYVMNVPNMSWYEWGHDIGFGAWKVGEILITRRVMPIPKAAFGYKTIHNASRFTTIQTVNTYGRWGKLGTRLPTFPYGRLTIDRATFINRNFIIPFGRTVGVGQLQYLQKK